MCRKLSQIYIGGSGNVELSPAVKMRISQNLLLFKDCEYKLYNDQTGRALIKNNFNDSVLGAYDRLIPYAYKADLLRYCILYLHGGWYMDLGIRCVSRVEIEDDSPVSMMAFRDLQRNAVSSWACSNSIIWSRAGNPVLKECINRIIKNVNRQYYGINKLAPTGPLLLGESIVSHHENINICFGDKVQLTPGYHEPNWSFVLASGEIVALGRSPRKDTNRALGFCDEFDYRRLWETRRVYASP